MIRRVRVVQVLFSYLELSSLVTLLVQWKEKWYIEATSSSFWNGKCWKTSEFLLCQITFYRLWQVKHWSHSCSSPFLSHAVFELSVCNVTACLVSVYSPCSCYEATAFIHLHSLTTFKIFRTKYRISILQGKNFQLLLKRSCYLYVTSEICNYSLKWPKM